MGTASGEAVLSGVRVALTCQEAQDTGVVAVWLSQVAGEVVGVGASLHPLGVSSSASTASSGGVTSCARLMCGVT
ncbi:hypothetical protein [Kineococcus sp. SYSU DK002]|uniref:hypothetical protein n=1 Tax=Kineococcus sp. SYSU DK002 TaxID=3383123 RepID=UPI003D7D1C58